MKQLIEDYQRRLKTVNEILESFKISCSVNDLKKEERLKAKAYEYRTFIAEMERLLNSQQGIETKPLIVLNQYEKQWILLCKGQLKEKYPFKGRWHETLKPLFTEIYGWNPDEDNNYRDYLRGMFNKLLDIYLKIKDNWTIENGQLHEIFEAAFDKGISIDEELPIERAIHKLCGLIQCTTVVYPDGSKRFELE